MAIHVDEVMNRELFNAEPDQPAAEVLGQLVMLEITGAPVLDDDGRCVGMVSLRDLLKARPGVTAASCMSSPVTVVPKGSTLEEAGRAMAERGYHRVVVVDEYGSAIGVASALDVMRGLLGLPVSHPSTFPHYDVDTGLNWTDDLPLSDGQVAQAPDGPGVLVLRHGGARRPERVVWAESTPNLRARLGEITTHPEAQPLLAAILESNEDGGGALNFRTAKEADPSRREWVVATVLERSGRRGTRTPHPGTAF